MPRRVVCVFSTTTASWCAETSACFVIAYFACSRVLAHFISPSRLACCCSTNSRRSNGQFKIVRDWWRDWSKSKVSRASLVLWSKLFANGTVAIDEHYWFFTVAHAHLLKSLHLIACAQTVNSAAKWNTRRRYSEDDTFHRYQQKTCCSSRKRYTEKQIDSLEEQIWLALSFIHHSFLVNQRISTEAQPTSKSNTSNLIHSSTQPSRSANELQESLLIHKQGRRNKEMESWGSLERTWEN